MVKKWLAKKSMQGMLKSGKMKKKMLEEAKDESTEDLQEMAADGIQGYLDTDLETALAEDEMMDASWKGIVQDLGDLAEEVAIEELKRRGEPIEPDTGENDYTEDLSFLEDYIAEPERCPACDYALLDGKCRNKDCPTKFV